MPTLVCGDLNAPPHGAELQPLSTTVPATQASDHRPLAVILSVTR